ncbi:MAG: (2Fe-2S) ferredoxin domain-containing protein [Eubacteriales bacterium]|nr:(2Fe-2S) ferredoxin domain-containing protein [Eubacteriales bacterium]
MKSLQELAEIRKRAQDNVSLRKENNGKRIVVGMATCGIAAGARPVLLKAVEEVQKRGLANVTVSQTGCIGMCRLEPIVDVFDENGEKVTYVKVTPDMIPRIITEHIVNGQPVQEYTIGHQDAN